MLLSIWTIETVKNKINKPYLILSSFIKLRHVRAITRLRLFPKVANSYTQVKYLTRDIVMQFISKKFIGYQ